MALKGIYKDGKPHGEWKSYYYNGGLESEKEYDNGAGTGEWKTYYENGSLKWKGIYKNGKLIAEQLMILL